MKEYGFSIHKKIKEYDLDVKFWITRESEKMQILLIGFIQKNLVLCC